VLVLFMPGPRSFTREDVVELHLPGSPHLLSAALRRVLDLGCSPAAPGEFTRRAFENGRIDLTRAEGVLALVEATHRAERRAATALLLGGLDRRLAELREELDELRAMCEASLDFDESESGHVPGEELRERAERCQRKLDQVLGWEERRETSLGQPVVVLAGLPNAGKSSLFNRLVQNGRALVSEHAGTTRDTVSGKWVLAGVETRLVDVAGEQQESRDLEARAQERARAERATADLVLLVVDACAGTNPPELESGGAPVLRIWNKIDAPSATQEPPSTLEGERCGWFPVSAREGRGLEDLSVAVARALGIASPAEGAATPPAGCSRGGEDHGLARELSARHRRALGDAREALEEARGGLAQDMPLDLVSECLRGASAALDQISGRTTPEDLLDRIFARFCLGK
jgi:tRNA modification GTPase